MTLQELSPYQLTEDLKAAQAQIAELESKLAASTHSPGKLVSTDHIPYILSITSNFPGVLLELVIRDNLTHFNFVSDHIWEIAGVSAQDVVADAQALFGRIHPDDSAAIREALSQSAATNKELRTEGRLKNRTSGQDRWWHLRANPQRQADGSTVFDGILVDISERKEREQKAEKSHDELQAVLDTLRSQIWYKDDKNNALRVNRAAANAVGYEDPDALIGVNMDAIFPKAEAEAYYQDDLDVIRSGQPKLGIVEPQTQGGELHWLQTDKMPHYNEAGEIIGVVAVIRDITDLRRAQTEVETLYSLSQRLASVRDERSLQLLAVETAFAHGAASSSLNYIEVDAQGQPEWMDNIVRIDANLEDRPLLDRIYIPELAYARLWVNTPYEPQLISDASDPNVVDEASRKLFAQLHIGALVIVPLYQAGKWVGLSIYTWNEPHQFSDEEVSVYRTLPPLLAPVVDNMRLLRDLENTVRELNQSLIFKDQFLATMSHELRTPMNAIMGYSSIALQRPNIPDKVREMLERIMVNSNRLLKLINDILDISRINAGRIQIVEDRLNLPSLVRGWHQDFTKPTSDKGLAFDFSYDESLPETIIGDGERLSQIVVNLLHNAVKFTDEGTIGLHATRLGNNMVVVVSDTGIGIPDTYHHLIFEEFRQVDMGAERRYGGTGLGLSIVQKLCVLMGGMVTVASELGKGSTFKVTLPLKIDSADAGRAG